MTKIIRTPPAFLQKKLTETKRRYVRKKLTEFVDKLTKQKRPDLLNLTPLEATWKFICYLGQKDKDFQNIDEDQVSTKHAGTYEIYNDLRKKMPMLDEKPMQQATPQPKGKPKKTTPESNKHTPLGEPTVHSVKAKVEHTDG